MDNDLRRLLTMATHDQFLGPEILEAKLDNITPISYQGRTVGFVIPQEAPDGRIRTGPIFVEPAFRGKGIAGEFIKEFFKDKSGKAWIDPMNKASVQAYLGAGFHCTGNIMQWHGVDQYEYVIN